MDLYIFGPQKPRGTIRVSGAKNSATRVLAAALLSSKTISLRNFPLLLEDAKSKIEFIKAVGIECEADADRSELTVTVPEVDFERIEDFDLPVRTTYLLAAGALARGARARVPYPGGCRIGTRGSRGYDLHLMVWRKMGCSAEERSDHIEVRGNLRGAVIDFPISTVGGTENALLCGTVAKGETLIKNAYVTPEVRDLIRFLREMGATIELEGNSLIRIAGADGPVQGASFEIMPDRIEALTWMVQAAVSGGELAIENIPFDALEVPLIHLREAGVDLYRRERGALVTQDCIGPHGIQPFELACGTHPGVISDMQPFFTVLAMFANGRSVIHDYRYPERNAYAHQLNAFSPGAVTARDGHIRVDGPCRLAGAEVTSTDLRGSMALVMAAIAAEGQSCIRGVEMALRGYNDLPAKLDALGIKCEWSV